jgi:glycosyltransferase involved in cell wall biosynthesis
MPDPAQPLRLTLLIGTYYPVVGGGERHAQLLAETLVRQGHQVRVVTRRSSAELAAREDFHGVEIFRVAGGGSPRWGKYWMMPAAFWQLWRLRKETDVVLVCAFRVLGWVGAIFRIFSGLPVVLRAEACGEWSGAFLTANQTAEKPSAPLRGLLFVRNRLLLRCDRFLSISGVIREEYLSGGIPEAKILGITNGIDLGPFQPVRDAGEKAALRRRLGLPEQGRIWCYAGKLIQGKGLDFLIGVFAGLAVDHPDLLLLLIGSGEGQFLSREKELQEQVAALGLGGRVRFTGYTREVEAYLRASDGMVFPSEAESLGLAPVEAMACGLPVLVSDVGGLKDVVEDGVSGLRLPVRDEAAWDRAWRKLLGDPGLARSLGRAGRERAVERFEIGAVARRTADSFLGLR